MKKLLLVFAVVGFSLLSCNTGGSEGESESESVTDGFYVYYGVMRFQSSMEELEARGSYSYYDLPYSPDTVGYGSIHAVRDGFPVWTTNNEEVSARNKYTEQLLRKLFIDELEFTEEEYSEIIEGLKSKQYLVVQFADSIEYRSDPDLFIFRAYTWIVSTEYFDISQYY